jgi:D-beta-D-heptose 7-phosphate kinase/D-beta-D-heptose 1-phosphate adenosyltransferase
MITDIPSFADARIMVVGDVMLDSYWHGDTGRISPEAPVPVVRVTEKDQRAGGAGNVALNIAALGGKVVLAGMIGNDEPGQTLTRILEKAGVECCFEQLETCPTITKLRIISRQQQLIRADFEDGAPASSGDYLIEALRNKINEVDLVVFSDYSKGALTRIREMITIAREHGKPVLVDPKQLDFSLYRDATVVTPNLSEFETIVGPCKDQDELVTKGSNLMQEHNLSSLLITRGEHGMTLLQQDAAPKHMPTHAREVYDVTGAGDTVISVLAAALAVGVDFATASHLANVGAGLVVAKLGTATISHDELRTALLEHHSDHQGVVSEDQLMGLLESARLRGESIVMTNGCFDILHVGHVTYLEQASRIGDRLVVAVNVDETVRRLKGADRPVNTMENRMAMLAALSCVDWVVAFSEDTPERLICRTKPDFLIKGGDNTPENIPGFDCVTENGGKVMVMDYIDGCSTTAIIHEIRARG